MTDINLNLAIAPSNGPTHIIITPTSDGSLAISISPSNEAPPWALDLLSKIGVVLQKEDQIMSQQSDALDQAEAAAAANAAADSSAEALLVTLSQMIGNLVSSQTDPATIARINALATALNDRAAQLSAAVVANTPVAPVP